jgi:membrane fusion protein (multidrug efflux system)
VRKHIKLISISLIAVVVLGIIIVPKIFSGKEKQQEGGGNRQQQNQSVLADGFIVKHTALENEVKTIGTIRANEEVELRSEVSRKITSINFKEGTYVGRGQTLFRLDASDLYAQLRKLELDEQITIRQLERDRQLVEKGLITTEEHELAENNLEKIRAEMDLLGIQISKTSIRAPFAGIIGLRNVSIGSYVTPTVTLSTIQDVGRVKIDFTIPEKYITVFKVGQKITYKVEGMNDDFEGEVYAFEPKLEGDTRSLLVRAVSSNPGRRLMPGTFANVVLLLPKIEDAVMVPAQAIIPSLGGHDIYVLRNGAAKLVKVEVGTRTEKEVQIFSDLTPGDTIITTNILRLKDGAKVKIEKAE